MSTKYDITVARVMDRAASIAQPGSMRSEEAPLYIYRSIKEQTHG